MNGMVNCKVKLLSDGELQEMRRFTLDDTSFASNFDLFKEKLRAVFPQLRTNAFKLTWTDSDNDVITIANDEDLVTAMMEMNGVKLMDVYIARQNGDDDQDDEEPELIPAAPFSCITCDVCNNRITRYRYKCLQCPDYDLCLTCEQGGNHSHHIMMRLANLEIPRCLPKIMGHMGRSARKAAYHANKEANRAVRSSMRAAQAAVQNARQAHQAHGQRRCQGRPASGPPKCPMGAQGIIDGSTLFDLAESFLGPFMHGQATATQGQASSSASNTGEANAAGSNGQQQTTPNQGQEAGTGATVPPTPPAEMLSNMLSNIFSAINANLPQPQPQGATPASTGTPTPTPPATDNSVNSGNSGVPFGTPVATTPTLTPTPSTFGIPAVIPPAVNIPQTQPVVQPIQPHPFMPINFQPPGPGKPQPHLFGGNPTSRSPPFVPISYGISTATPRIVPMEVESDKTIYPVIPAGADPVIAPDAGWTFIQRAEQAQAAAEAATQRQAQTQGTKSVAQGQEVKQNQPSAPPLKPEDAKYADALEQLRKMGFSENLDLLGLLRLFNGNIGAVVNHLFEVNTGK